MYVWCPAQCWHREGLMNLSTDCLIRLTRFQVSEGAGDSENNFQ